MGYPLRDLEVSLKGVECKKEELSALALQAAAYQTFRKGLMEVGSTLLEPIFKLEVSSPEEFRLYYQRFKWAQNSSGGNTKTKRF